MADFTSGTLNVPMLTLSAEGISPRLMESGSMDLPMLLLSGEAEVGNFFELPMLTLSGTVLSENYLTDVDLALPMLTAAGQMIAEQRYASGNLALPMIELEAFGGFESGAMTLPMLGLEAAAISGNAMTGGLLSLPLLALEGVLTSSSQEAIGAFDLPLLTLAGSMIQGGVASGSFDLPMIALDASMVGGQVGSAAFDLPMLTLDASGGATHAFAGGALVLPMLLLEAASPSVLLTTSRSVVINMKTGAISHYSAFNFNSFGYHNGQYVGVQSNGIYALAGSTDAGSPIQAVITLPPSDLGIPRMKRIVQAYVAYRATGPMELRLKTEDSEWFVYELEETRPSGFYRNRVKVGRGLRANHFQAELANVDGGDFAIERLELDAEALTRKLS